LPVASGYAGRMAVIWLPVTKVAKSVMRGRNPVEINDFRSTASLCEKLRN
jgi:hypothetical protein